MKKLEMLIGALSGLGFALLALYAASIVGILIYKGPAPSPMAVTAAARTAEPAEETADAAAETGARRAVAAEKATAAAATTGPAVAVEATEAGPYADLADDAVITLDPVPYPEGVTYADLLPPSEEELAAIAARVAALEATIPGMDYETARYHPLHFPPASKTAADAECLVCHREVLANDIRAFSPAGLSAEDSLAWYQTLDVYSGPQADFHWRHLQSDFARSVMKLECSFCHQGTDPREESPDMMPGRPNFTAPDEPEFTLRKTVNTSETCLLCHGALSGPEEIMGLAGPWHEVRGDWETAEAPNGCLTCHAEFFRTNRHQVNYLQAATIEDLARNGTSDTCYACHGGRAWYQISYPYARTPWPGMDTSTIPDWAKDRPTESRPEHRIAE